MHRATIDNAPVAAANARAAAATTRPRPTSRPKRSRRDTEAAGGCIGAPLEAVVARSTQDGMPAAPSQLLIASMSGQALASAGPAGQLEHSPDVRTSRSWPAAAAAMRSAPDSPARHATTTAAEPFASERSAWEQAISTWPPSPCANP